MLKISFLLYLSKQSGSVLQNKILPQNKNSSAQFEWEIEKYVRDATVFNLILNDKLNLLLQNYKQSKQQTYKLTVTTVIYRKTTQEVFFRFHAIILFWTAQMLWLIFLWSVDLGM